MWNVEKDLRLKSINDLRDKRNWKWVDNLKWLLEFTLERERERESWTLENPPSHYIRQTIWYKKLIKKQKPTIILIRTFKLT